MVGTVEGQRENAVVDGPAEGLKVHDFSRFLRLLDYVDLR